MILDKGVSFLILITIFWIVIKVIDYVGLRLKARAEKTESKVDDQLIPFAIEIGKVLEEGKFDEAIEAFKKSIKLTVYKSKTYEQIASKL